MLEITRQGSPESHSSDNAEPGVEDLKAELREAYTVYREKLTRWLAWAENRTCESHKEGLELLRLIRALARCAGAELLYKEKPVTLQIGMAPNQKRPTIQALINTEGKRETVYAGQKFPKLESRSAEQ